jgi:enoyl-CoA hydratase/carnithine racemase
MAKSHFISWEILDSIGVLTLDDPPENYIKEPDFLELPKLIKWSTRPDIKGLIITGKGKHFTAGADISSLVQLSRNRKLLFSKISEGKKILKYIEDIEIPTIASIQGACFGGGLEIALACHIRVCNRNAIFAFPEINHGLIPGLGGTVRLPVRVGFGTAMQMLLSGDIVDAEIASSIGLVDHVVASRQAFDFSLALMKKMVADRPLKLIKAVVHALNNSRRLNTIEAMKEETKMFCKFAANLHDKI